MCLFAFGKLSCDFIGVSMSEPLPGDVNVDFVCHGPAYGMAMAHASRFLHVAVYATMVTLFRQSIDNTYSNHLSRA